MIAPRGLLSVIVLIFLAPLVAMAQSDGRMSGTVTDPDGKPVKDVVIRLEPRDENGVNVDTKTKKKGTYLIGLIRPGGYNLVLEAPNNWVLLRLEGRAVDVTGGRRTLWEVNTEVTADNLPPLNVGPFNQIELNMVVGPPEMTAEARHQAAVEAAQDAYTQGSSKIESGDYAGGLALLLPLLEESPDHVGLNYLVAFAENRLGENDSALDHLERALAVEPGFPGGNVLLGTILRDLGRTDDAEDALRKEIEAASDRKIQMQAYIALAVLYEKTDRVPEAIATLEAASAVDPQREILLELANLYSRTGDRAKAEKALERAEAAGGMDDVALLNLAIGHINDKNYDEAERVASKLVEKGSTNANLSMAHSVLARCDLNRGKLDEGAEHLRKSLELDPESPLAAENKEILAALKR
jgi:tetratricopeptide (TPR) repeat protein